MKFLFVLLLAIALLRGNFTAVSESSHLYSSPRFSFRFQYEFTLKKFQNCPVNQSITMFVDVNDTVPAADVIRYSGFLEASREIRGPLELVIETNRCDVGLKKCEKMPTVKFTGLCEKFKDKKAFYHATLSGLTPSLECPIKPQRYVATNSSMLDLSPIAFLPLGGYIWLVTLKVSSGEPKQQELVMCTMIEISIAQVKRKRRKN
jgi:hypothetical protein